MTTFLDLQTEVRQNIIDLPTTVTNSVPTLIKRALRNLQRKNNFKVMGAQASFVTTEGSRIIGSVPADLKSYHFEPWFVRNLGSISKMTIVANEGGLYPEYSQLATGYPLFLVEGIFTDAGTRFMQVYPIPDGNSDYSDGEYRIVVPYWRYLTLVSNTDTNWFTENADEFLVAYATAEGFAKDWDEERMAAWMQKAEIARKDTQKADKALQLDHVDTLVPHWGGVNAPRTRL